jgi:hypothetical protein
MDSGAFDKTLDLPDDAHIAALQECGFAPYEMTRHALWRCVTDAGMLMGAPPPHLSADDIAVIVLSLCHSYRHLPPSTQDSHSTRLSA